MEDNTTALNSSLLLPEFDDKENDPPIAVDNLGIYSELDHQRLAGIRSLFSRSFLQV
jgi:hypothetical protein